MDNKLLDHYYLKLSNGSLGVVTGNWHTNHCVIGYIKYSATNKQTLWSEKTIFYERLVKRYNPSQVREHTNWKTYIPYFDQNIPCIPLEKVVHVYNPLKRAIELLSRVRDELELAVLELLLDIIENTGILPGLTGSLLPGIHNIKYSDIDLVVYGIKTSTEVREYVEANADLYTPFNNTKLRYWAENVSLNTNTTPKEVLRFYRNWRRGTFKGHDYSIIYNDGVYREVLLFPPFKTYGVIKIIADVHGGVDALNYPTKAKVFNYRVIETSTSIPYEIEELFSYEALYTTGFYEGGVFEIQGLLQCSDLIETCRVLLGVYECRGYAKYYE